MLKELFDRIVGFANENQKVSVVDVKDPRKILLQQGDKLIERDIPPAFRSHEVYTLFDLIAAAKHEAFCVAPTIWHNDEGVILLLNDHDRREQVTLSLELSPAFTSLAKLGAEVAAGDHTGFEPKALATFLRRNLAGTLYDRRFVENLRKLKWKTQEELRQQFGAGKESIGKDIEAELQADVPIPEELTIEVPVYTNPDEDDKFTVRCLVDVDAFTKRINFLPEPGSLEAAMQAKQKDIRERLDAELPKVPIFQGTP